MGDRRRGTRLDSWKEIAVYLGKAERTVKRWKKERGLPAYRAPGSGNASIYAYTLELDEWLKSGRAAESDTVVELAGDEQPGAEAESFDRNDPGIDSEPPAFGPIPVSVAPTTDRGLRRNWLLAVLGLLVAGIIGAAITSTAVRATSERIAHLFSGDRTRRRAGTSIPVSDSEKSQAHALYLKGRFEWGQRTPDSLNRALDYFTQALVHDPGDAEAYAGLADTYDLLREYSTMPDSEAYQRAIAAAKKAVELDGSLAEAHRALAFAEYYGNWDFIDGEKEFRRAIELNPNDAVAHKWYANAIFLRGRYADSLKEIDIAQELDPSSLSLVADKGQMLFYGGHGEEGIAMLKEAERSDPGFGSPHFYLMRIAFDSRDYPTFLAEGKTLAESKDDPVLTDIFAAAQAGYAQSGERGLLDGLYKKQELYYAAGKVSAVDLAQTCDRMGKKAEALRLIEEACARHDTLGLAVSLPSLKDDPQYKALMKRLNLAPPP
jgi:tetratricopeptide (TPR) repeat protein